MSGLTPIPVMPVEHTLVEPGAVAHPTPDAHGFSALPDDNQLAFTRVLPASSHVDTGLIDNRDSLGDRVLAGLTRIGSSFSALDSLMAQAMPGANAGGDPQGISGGVPGVADTTSYAEAPSIPAHVTAHDIPAILKSVEAQGVAMYNQQFAREVRFTSAEFEAHIVTVASQNMSSTLKSLLSQGG